MITYPWWGLKLIHVSKRGPRIQQSPSSAYIFTTLKPLIHGAQNPKTSIYLVSSCSCLCQVHWSQMLSREWRCSWNSADNYIWVINDFTAHEGAVYIRGLTVHKSSAYIYLILFLNSCYCFQTNVMMHRYLLLIVHIPYNLFLWLCCFPVLCKDSWLILKS